MPRSRSLRAALPGVFLILAGCAETHHWVEREKPWSTSSLEGSDRARIERADGTEATVEEARVDRGESGLFLSGRDVQPPGREVRIEMESIRSLQVREVDPGKTAAALAAGVVVVGAIVLYLVSPFFPSA